jgi:nuclear transcription factor Y alpha
MDYTAYQQPHAHTHNAYAPTHNGQSGPPVTSPTQQNQVSPIMSQQNHAYGQQPGPNVGQHQVMPMYQQAYPVQGMHYGLGASQMSPTQAAAMATAAASGNYSYMPETMQPLAQDPRQSPRIGQSVKSEQRQTPRSPSQSHMNVNTSMAGQMVMPAPQAIPQQMVARRMSQAVQPPQPVMQQQRRASVAPQMVQQVVQQHSSPEAPTGTTEESPLYVNAKQFHRILKRRLARQKLEEQLRLTSKGRPGGRFLTAEEVAALDAEAAKNGGLPMQQPTNGTKRKSGDNQSSPSKKSRTQSNARSMTSEEDSIEQG